MPTNKNQNQPGKQQQGQEPKRDSQQTRGQQEQSQTQKQHGNKSSGSSQQHMSDKYSQRAKDVEGDMNEMNTDEE